MLWFPLFTITMFVLPVAPNLYCNLEKLRSYDNLFDSASLVVIVETLSVRPATEQDKIEPPRDMAKYLDPFVAHLLVLHVVKGTYADDTLDLVHYRWKKDAPIINATDMVKFRTSDGLSGWLAQKHLRYSTGGLLLFLTKTKEGRYEFVTGQLTPSQSVRQLQPPAHN
jgi:hypothetical protein